MSGAAISRGAFLRGLVRRSTAAAADPAGAEDAEPLPTGLFSDFPPELLADEAQRLGLDPAATDRETLVRLVYRRMQASRPAATEGPDRDDDACGKG